MARTTYLLPLFLLVLITAQPAHALPAPMSDEELMAKSDLVALVRVMSVTCTGVTTDKETGEELPSYLAALQVLEVKKGDVKPGQEVFVTFRAIRKGALGPWTVFYYPGEEVWTHLQKRSVGVSYATTWWNAKGEPLTPPDTTDLPKKIGESVVIGGGA